MNTPHLSSERPAQKAELTKAYLKAHGLSCAAKGLFVGLYGVDDVLWDILQEGAQALGKELLLHRLNDFEDEELLGALDVCIVVDGGFSDALLRRLAQYCVIPVVSRSTMKGPSLVEHAPAREQGWGFVYGDASHWVLFAMMVRLLETRRFSYDWNTLRKRALEAGA